MDEFRHLVARRDYDNALVIELIDPRLFDMATITALQDELLSLFDQEQPRRTVVDFTRVSHCSTAVINGLLRAKKRIQANDGQLKLCGMINSIRDAYKMLNLDGTVFQIYDNLDDALDSF